MYIVSCSKRTILYAQIFYSFFVTKDAHLIGQQIKRYNTLVVGKTEDTTRTDRYLNIKKHPTQLQAVSDVFYIYSYLISSWNACKDFTVNLSSPPRSLASAIPATAAFAAAMVVK